MKKVVCSPQENLPIHFNPETLYISMYSSTKRHEIGHLGLNLPTAIRKSGLTPTVESWDFATIALAVAAADKAILRNNSPDGWTRMIDLSISLASPASWNNIRPELESMLKFLTGDFWSLRFLSGGMKPPKSKKPQNRNADCVCLLSGGIDSLVGAIDLTGSGKKPLFVSQVMRGDREAQKRFATALNGSESHLQWSFAVRHPNISEKSTRARSLVFFAFAALGASAIPSSEKKPVEIVVPENGFISLNVPLGPGRIGSLSTKTTHPIFTNQIQKIWDVVGINARLTFPYRDKTKGELLRNCVDRRKLASLVGISISCGKYRRHNLMHCGECVPCLIRRAAFLKANLRDTTKKKYLNPKLSTSKSKDVAAAAAAFLRYKEGGVRRFVGGALSFATPTERIMYEGVVERGMEELGQLLEKEGVI